MPSEYDEQPDATDALFPGEYDLFDLMAHVTEENLHAPVDSGPPVGREALPAQPENRFSARSGIGFVDGRQSRYGKSPDDSPDNSPAIRLVT
jgi:antitoxin MazE